MGYCLSTEYMANDKNAIWYSSWYNHYVNSTKDAFIIICVLNILMETEQSLTFQFPSLGIDMSRDNNMNT